MPRFDYYCEHCEIIEEHIVEHKERNKPKKHKCGKYMIRKIAVPNTIIKESKSDWIETQCNNVDKEIIREELNIPL